MTFATRQILAAAQSSSMDAFLRRRHSLVAGLSTNLRYTASTKALPPVAAGSLFSGSELCTSIAIEWAEAQNCSYDSSDVNRAQCQRERSGGLDPPDLLVQKK